MCWPFFHVEREHDPLLGPRYSPRYPPSSKHRKSTMSQRSSTRDLYYYDIERRSPGASGLGLRIPPPDLPLSIPPPQPMPVFVLSGESPAPPRAPEPPQYQVPIGAGGGVHYERPRVDDLDDFDKLGYDRMDGKRRAEMRGALPPSPPLTPERRKGKSLYSSSPSEASESTRSGGRRHRRRGSEMDGERSRSRKSDRRYLEESRRTTNLFEVPQSDQRGERLVYSVKQRDGKVRDYYM